MIHYSFVGYMLATAIIMIICMGVYRMLLENKVRPSANRLILLSIYTVSFLLPLIVGLIPDSKIEPGIEIGLPEFAGVPQDIDIEAEGKNFGLQELMVWIPGIYFIGLFLTFLFSLIATVHLVFLFRSARKMKIDEVEVYVHSNKKLSSFSWCNKIFLFEDSLNSEVDNLNMLIFHEKVHLKKGHWIDLAFAQIVLIFQWFNPAAWFARRELQRIHEYEADEEVLQSGINEKDYQMLLIQNISGNRYSGLTDGLNNCSLKKRIIMMKKTKFKKDWVARGIAVCGFAILGGFIIHIPAVSAVLEEMKIIDNSSSSSENNAVKFDRENLNTEDKDTASLYYLNGDEVTKDIVSSVDPGNIKEMVIDKSSEDPKVEITTKETNKPAEYNGSVSYNYVSDKKKGEIESYPDAYVEVDKPAEYIGGQMQLLRDLSETVNYPEEAKEKEIEGRVVVRFQINTNGTLSNCEVAHSQNPMLNEAALQAVEKLPGKWEPAEVDGKPVASIFNMPVTFRLQK